MVFAELDLKGWLLTLMGGDDEGQCRGIMEEDRRCSVMPNGCSEFPH